jgi:hypothetical protein
MPAKTVPARGPPGAASPGPNVVARERPLTEGPKSFNVKILNVKSYSCSAVCILQQLAGACLEVGGHHRRNV